MSAGELVPADSYFASTGWTRAYRFNSLTAAYEALLPGTGANVEIGKGYYLALPGDTKIVVSTFTVNSTNDVDDGNCDTTHCSLREAINAANFATSSDAIAFNITTTDPGYVASTTSWRIRPTSSLPTITDPVVIDGYTQPGASPNTSPYGAAINAILKTELDGTNAGSGASGFTITGGGSIVRGLVINQFGDRGIEITTNGGNVVEGNFIGTDINGTAQRGNIFDGIRMFDSANNIVGGLQNSERNIISGNYSAGIRIVGSGSTGNSVKGNFIGTDRSGTVALARIHRGTRMDGVRTAEGGG